MPSNTAGRLITDQAKKGLTSAIEGYVRGGLDDLAYAAGDLPAFLADDTPVVAAALPTKVIIRAACRTYARGFGPQNLPGFDAVWQGICEPYLESIGENPGDGSLAPPFEGGQCEAVQYRVNLAGRNTTSQPATAARIGPGPVGGVVIGPPNQFSARSIGVSFSDGVNFSGPGTSSTNNRNADSWVITSIVRIDGLADSCGNPPTEYNPAPIPPGLPPLSPTSPVDFPGIGPVNIGVEFSPEGDLIVTAPELGIEVNVGGDADGGGGGGGTPEPGTPGESSETGAGGGGGGGSAGGGTAEGDAPEGQVLTGVKLEVLEAPASRRRYTEQVDRGVAYVYMGTPSEGLGLEPTGATVRDGQFFFAQKDYLTRHSVRANVGYNIRVTPYYRPREE